MNFPVIYGIIMLTAAIAVLIYAAYKIGYLKGMEGVLMNPPGKPEPIDDRIFSIGIEASQKKRKKRKRPLKRKRKRKSKA